MIAQIRTRLRALVRRRATDDDVAEEIRYHVEREAERNLAKGMSADDARDAARRAFGNVTIATEQSREAWRWQTLEELRQKTGHQYMEEIFMSLVEARHSEPGNGEQRIKNGE